MKCEFGVNFLGNWNVLSFLALNRKKCWLAESGKRPRKKQTLGLTKGLFWNAVLFMNIARNGRILGENRFDQIAPFSFSSIALPTAASAAESSAAAPPLAFSATCLAFRAPRRTWLQPVWARVQAVTSCPRVSL